MTQDFGFEHSTQAVPARNSTPMMFVCSLTLVAALILLAGPELSLRTSMLSSGLVCVLAVICTFLAKRR
jgi:hypothetical protein